MQWANGNTALSSVTPKFSLHRVEINVWSACHSSDVPVNVRVCCVVALFQGERYETLFKMTVAPVAPEFHPREQYGGATLYGVWGGAPARNAIFVMLTVILLVRSTIQSNFLCWTFSLCKLWNVYLCQRKKIKFSCWLLDFTNSRPSVYANRLNAETPVFSRTIVHLSPLSEVSEAHNSIIRRNDVVK